MLGLLGFLPIAMAIVAIASTAFSIYTYYDGKDRAEKAEKKNDALMDKQERKAKANTLKQMNQALAWGRGEGVAMAEKRILEEKRELRAKERDYGEPLA